MKFSPNGTPYDTCPICGQMIMPKEFGGKKHIESHKLSEASKYFRQGMNISQVNTRLYMEGITLFPSIPPQLRNVTEETILSYDGNLCRMTDFADYDCIEIEFMDSKRHDRVRLWDGRLQIPENKKGE